MNQNNRSTIGSRLKSARMKRQLSQAKLAQAVGVSQGLIAQIEGNTNEGSKHVIGLAVALGVSPEWLLTGRGDQGASTSNVTQGPELRDLVPLISWVQAGDWCEAVDNFEPGDAEEWLACPRSHGPSTFALRVRGVSMEPKYRDGAIIFVDPDRVADHLSNVVVRLEDETEVTFKQMVVEGDKRFLRALNPDWPGPKLIKVNSDATICGVVIGQFIED